MKTIFDTATRNELIARIQTLDENSTALWGKMNVYQMIMHCMKADEVNLGEKVQKQAFIGKLFGKLALKKVMKDEAPLGRNSPTSPQLRMSGAGDVSAAKAKWISILQGYANYSKPEFVHEFFGTMTREQVGVLAYKHVDHHLRQFGA
jgi:hypothetical protein